MGMFDTIYPLSAGDKTIYVCADCHATVTKNMDDESAVSRLYQLAKKYDNNGSFEYIKEILDYNVNAYKAAKEIEDESERAEALLYLVESVDRI